MSFGDSGLAASTTYYYKVRAGDGIQFSALSAAVSGTAAAGGAPPSTPNGLSVGTGTITTLAFSWDAVAGISRYQLYRDSSAGGAYSTLVHDGSATSATDSASLAAGTEYYYKVRAVDGAGVASSLSAAVSGYTLDANGLPLVVTVPYGSNPTPPAGWKASYITGPGGTTPPSVVPVLKAGGYTFWVFSKTDNSWNTRVCAYDAAGTLLNGWDVPGDRYVYAISTDAGTGRVYIYAQDDVGVWILWSTIAL